MEAEQLKLIMDAIVTMSETGKDAFVLWLIMDKALPVVGWLLTFSGIIFIGLRLMKILVVYEKFKELRDTLGIGGPGEMLNREAEETLKRALEIVREYKKSK